MPDRLTCDDVSSQDLIARYAGGTLSEEGAAALEAHCLECEACGADLEAAMDLRSVLLASPAEFRPLDRGSAAALNVTRLDATMAGSRRDCRRADARRGSRLAVGPHEGRCLGPSRARGSVCAATLLATRWFASRVVGRSGRRHHLPCAPRGPVHRWPFRASHGERTVTFQAETMQRLTGAHVEVQAENVAGEVLARSEPMAVPPR